MTKQQIKNRIDEIEERLWDLNMIDRWSRREEQEVDTLRKELRTLRQLLRTMEE